MFHDPIMLRDLPRSRCIIWPRNFVGGDWVTSFASATAHSNNGNAVSHTSFCQIGLTIRSIASSRCEIT